MKYLLPLMILATGACAGKTEVSQFKDGEQSPVNTDGMDVLICQSEERVEGWDSAPTNDFVRYTAYIESKTKIHRAVVRGAYSSDMRSLTADEDLEGRFDRHRFRTLEDAWCWFNLLVPEGFSTQRGSFSGAIQYTCEEWFSYNYIDMSCFVRARN